MRQPFRFQKFSKKNLVTLYFVNIQIIMGDLSFGEIFVIFLVIMIFFGPKKIPQIVRELGQGLRKMRGAVDDIKQEIMKETEENPVSEIKNEIDKVKQEAANLMQEEDKKTK